MSAQMIIEPTGCPKCGKMGFFPRRSVPHTTSLEWECIMCGYKVILEGRFDD